MQVVSFLKAYIKSMRLYYGFVTGIAGWIGVAFYHFIQPDQGSIFRSIIVLPLLFLTWGINQIVNDYLGIAEDRINAPHRPMVTGELNPGFAMEISGALMILVAIFSWFLNPWTLVPIAIGVGLNVLYEFAKAWSLWGNVIFGLSIAMCTVYGFLVSGPTPSPFFTPNRVCVFTLVAVLNGLMTYYTYFKDVAGDAAAGKQTFIVKYGIRAARYAGLVAALIPTALFALFHLLGWLPLSDVVSMRDFVFCAAVTVFLQLWTAILYFRSPEGEKSYYSLVTNFRACVAGQVTLIAIFNGTLALYLMIASYIFIGFLFDLHGDHQA